MSILIDVSKDNGTPKWMVKIMENPIKMDDLVVPLFLETPLNTLNQANNHGNSQEKLLCSDREEFPSI